MMASMEFRRPDLETTLEALVTVTPKGYRAVLFAIALRKLRFVLPVMAFFAFAALATGGQRYPLLMMVGLIGVIAFVWLYVNWVSGSPAHKDVYVPVRYRFSEDGIEYDSAIGTGAIPWDRVCRWRFFASHYLLYTESSAFLLVGASALSDTAKGTFESLLAEKVRKRASWRPLSRGAR